MKNCDASRKRAKRIDARPSRRHRLEIQHGSLNLSDSQTSKRESTSLFHFISIYYYYFF